MMLKIYHVQACKDKISQRKNTIPNQSWLEWIYIFIFKRTCEDNEYD